MRAPEVALVGAIAWHFPELRAQLAEHLADHDGVVLPHLLMADYERWAETALAGGNPLPQFLEFLEEAFRSGGPEVEELISVSFLEHLPRPGEPQSELRHLLGPALSKELDVIG